MIYRGRSSVEKYLKVGYVPDGDYIDLNKTQGKRYKGNSTVWKDMIADLFGKRLSSAAGKVDYDYDENAIKFQANGSLATRADRIGGNNEINHEFKIGTGITFKPHIHWWQQVTGGAVLPIVFTARYRLQRNGYVKVTAWTTVTAEAGAGGDDVYDFTGEDNGLYNQLTHFNDITIDCGVSDTIQFQLTRTDSEAGDVLAYFFDIHGEVDSDGSDEELSKT